MKSFFWSTSPIKLSTILLIIEITHALKFTTRSLFTTDPHESCLWAYWGCEDPFQLAVAHHVRVSWSTHTQGIGSKPSRKAAKLLVPTIRHSHRAFAWFGSYLNQLLYFLELKVSFHRIGPSRSSLQSQLLGDWLSWICCNKSMIGKVSNAVVKFLCRGWSSLDIQRL